MRARAITFNQAAFAAPGSVPVPDIWPLLRGAGLAVGGVAATGATIATVTTVAAWIVTMGLSHQPSAPYAQPKAGLRALALVESVPMLLGPTAVRTPQFVALPEPVATPQATAETQPAAADVPATAEVAPPPLPPRRAIAEAVPVPQPRPVIHELAAAPMAPKVEPAPVKLATAALVPVPLSEQKNRDLQGLKKQAALPPVTHTPALPQISRNPVLPPAGSKIALYDISGHTVYLPNGQRLEAHSGVGERMDDPSQTRVKMRGPTPPNIYRLTMREALFHGVRAIRLTPVDYGKMFGRDGMLAHTYMLGPSGQSNGCVSFKNYNAFLQAYLNGEVDRMVVVPNLSEAPARIADAMRNRVASAE